MSVLPICTKRSEPSPNWPITISGQILVNGQVIQAEVLVPSLFRSIYALQNELQKTQNKLISSQKVTMHTKTEVDKRQKLLERAHEEKKIALAALKKRNDELRSTRADLREARSKCQSLEHELINASAEIQKTTEELHRLRIEWRKRTDGLRSYMQVMNIQDRTASPPKGLIPPS